MKSYTRKQLIDTGVQPIDVKRVETPYDYPFAYKTTHRIVKVSPAEDCLSNYKYSRLMTFVSNNYEVEPRSCHSTAGIIAMFLKDMGVDARVVDGFYERLDTREVFAHSFCKVGQLYFDPTIEFVFGYNRTQCYKYFSEREFEAYEYLVMQMAMGYACTASITPFYTSTLMYYYDEQPQDECPTSDFILDNNGFILGKTNDEIEQFYSGLNITYSRHDDELFTYTVSVGYR